MKVSAINTIPKVQFSGENSNSKKANGIKTAAGATMIALATAVPSQEAQAQYYVPIYPRVQYVVPTPTMNIPNCFVYGDINNEDYEKTMPDVFNEIDSQINQNGQISVNEVVALEEYNWNSTNMYPMTRAQKQNTANLVKNLSRQYNQKGSNPNTINYNEYKNIMNSYMQSKNIANFFNLLQIFASPYYHIPYPYPPLCPPHHHHRHHR